MKMYIKLKSYETYQPIDNWDIKLAKTEPYCFNGNVQIKRYSVTIEEIKESKDVLIGRLQKLWDESDSQHDSGPLQAVAIELGYELKGIRGNKVKK